ncbi:MAG: 6,7-dimethyl-8-ribityllumazine synthase [Rhodospirillales bacterium]|nr:6,7-dimethyl-8-ribityllumazine synthase [Rhodospirillales bacterium]
MSDHQKILVIEARFYDDIADKLAEGACAVLVEAGYSVERVPVPGVFEIPAAAALGWNSGQYAGVVTLGCVIRGETDHYDHICREMSRRLMDLSVDDQMPHGFGVLTCENRSQAEKRADPAATNVGGRAGEAVIAMIAIKSKFLKTD